jgi:spermidine synthase
MVPALAGLFFLSGAAALVYQVAWLRMISLVFGVTVYAASAVLTSFMGGLALGS